MRLARPTLHAETLILLAAAWLLAACNGPFWRAALGGRDWGLPGTWALAAAMAVSFTAAYVAFCGLLATRWTVRPLLAVLLVTGAALSYYIDRYGVFFDRGMLRNVLATQWSEARELLGPAFVLHIVAFGVLPAALLWWPRLGLRPSWRALAVRAAWVVGGIVVAVAVMLPVFADFGSMMRNNRQMRFLLTPGNAVVALLQEAWGSSGRAPAASVPVGTDARLAASWQQRRPTLLVVVVGETARAQNFGLDGYARDTTPELAKRGVVNFPDVTACGTSTEVSLPCMFSPYGRRHYDEEKIATHESLLHVLKHAGVPVLWRDNQSGCKGVCQGLPAEQVDQLPGVGCPAGGCLDESLLHGLQQRVDATQGSLVLVMHQLGSHGPSYFRRYPPAFRRFQPACEQDELRRCSQPEIVNAYDNTILYTDHVLGRVIDFLAAQEQRFDTGLLYVSDHGESLGESGLYLHGVPYAIAPDVQKKVPMVAWLSPALARSTKLDVQCLRGRAARPASHDNLFHSVLGLMDVRTSVYDADMDLFRPCRS